MEAQIQRSPCSWNVMDRAMESCCDVPQKMSETIPFCHPLPPVVADANQNRVED